MLANHFIVSAEEFHVQNWRREDGLPDGQITAINQTPDGYLWIGTAKGLARFDGVRFKVFRAGDAPGLTDSRISSLATDSRGVLWVGMLDGNITRWIGNGFSEIQPPVPAILRNDPKRIPSTWLWDRRMAMIEEAEHTPASATGHFSDYRAQIAIDTEGTIWWLVSELGLARFKGGIWSCPTQVDDIPVGNIRQVICDHLGQAWFQADGRLQPLMADQTNTLESTNVISSQWAVLAPARQGGLWVIEPRSSWLHADGKILRRFNGQWHDPLSLDTPTPRPANAVITCLLEDHSGRIWCGTASGGVFFSDSKDRWERLKPKSFSQGYISCMFEDRQGCIWVGTVGDGIYRVSLQPASMLDLPAPYEYSEINTTYVTRQGLIWMGTGGSGAISYDGAHFMPYGSAAGLANQHVCALFEDSHARFWAGTAGGLFCWNDGHFAAVNDIPELSTWVKCLFEDSHGRLWIGGLGGVVCKDGEHFNMYYLRPDHSYCDVRCMAEDTDGNLWIGTIKQGLFCLPQAKPDNIRHIDGFPTVDVRALFFGSNSGLWVGSWGSGLFHMRNDRLINVNTEDGLPSDRIQSIIGDATGAIWMSTDNGLVGFKPEQIQNYHRGQTPPLICKHISLAEGLANGGCSGSGQPVASRTPDGRLWFPDYEGVAILDPRKVAQAEMPITVLVEAIIADGMEIKPSNGQWQVSSGVRRFEFDFTAPNLAYPTDMHFRHKLDGMDHDWIYSGVQRAAYYSQLPPGDYAFRVEVGGTDNQWHAAKEVIRLQIIPRFWEQRWLQIVATALLITFIGGAIALNQRRKYRIRVERLQLQNATENERRRIARDLHDEFGSSLTGIALQGEAATLGGCIPASIREEFVSITQRVRQLIGKLDEVVWATNPANDSLKNFVTYVYDYAEQFLSPTNIHCRLDPPDVSELPDLVLNAKTRHNLLLAIKEALHNAVKHSDAQTVWVKINATSKMLVVEIVDDGCGFDLLRLQSNGNGLKNISGRLELILGNAQFQSQPNKGTSIKLITPFCQDWRMISNKKL